MSNCLKIRQIGFVKYWDFRLFGFSNFNLRVLLFLFMFSFRRLRGCLFVRFTSPFLLIVSWRGRNGKLKCLAWCLKKLFIASWRSKTGEIKKSLWSDLSRFITTTHHPSFPILSLAPICSSSAPISSSSATISPIFKISLNLSVDSRILILGFPDWASIKPKSHTNTLLKNSFSKTYKLINTSTKKCFLIQKRTPKQALQVAW